jgi:hypothetical protein
MVAGYIPAVQVVTINLEASSPSLKYFNQLYDAMVTGRTIYICNLVCTVPSISTVFKFLNGVLQTGAPFPAHKKILDATSWTYHFERMERSAL